MPADADAVLDNLAWHALTGPHAELAEGTGRVRRYPAETSIFAAMDSPIDAGSWEEMASLVGPGGVLAMMRRRIVPPPDGWNIVLSEEAFQMVLPDDVLLPEVADVSDLVLPVDASPMPPGAASPWRIELLARDAWPEMLELAKLTEPGPFGPRTPSLGRYHGVRDETGALVAMAGERFRSEGWVEISGVCTHPSARGRGLAAALTTVAAAAIRADGQRVVLHVRGTNLAAKRVYDRLGFELRTMVQILAAFAPS